MEGIMTGITPRKMYEDGSLSATDQSVIDSVKRKMNLIDTISGSGSSPLGDPLTQFLLSTGQNLIGGESAGGTKLQELVGATKKPLDRAMKMQQLKDMSRRKLAASLIAKTKPDDARKLFNALKNRINPKTGKLYTFEDVAGDKAMTELYKKETSPLDRRFQKERDIKADLGKFKDFLRNPKYSEIEKTLISGAFDKIKTNKNLLSTVDKQNPYYQGSDYTVGKATKINDKAAKVLIPNDKDDFTGNKSYFMIEENAFFVFDENAGRLIELPGV